MKINKKLKKSKKLSPRLKKCKQMKINAPTTVLLIKYDNLKNAK